MLFVPVKINEKSIEGRIPVYLHYPGQHNPQPAHIYLTEEGEAGASVSGEIGSAVPMKEFHHRTLTWEIPGNVRGEYLRKFLSDREIKYLLGKVHQGHFVAWDGNNHVGCLTSKASEAMEKISAKIDDFFTEETLVNVTSLEEYLTMYDSPEGILRNVLYGKSVDDASREIAEDILLDNAIFIDGNVTSESVSETLVDLAERAIEDGNYGLSRSQYDDLIAHGLDREKLLYLLADAAAGEHFESPEAKETLALGDWTGYRIFLDGDGDITGRIVSEKEIEQVKQARESNPFPYSVGELNEVKRLPYLLGKSFCLDPDDLPEGSVVKNGVVIDSPLGSSSMDEPVSLPAKKKSRKKTPGIG